MTEQEMEQLIIRTFRQVLQESGAVIQTAGEEPPAGGFRQSAAVERLQPAEQRQTNNEEKTEEAEEAKSDEDLLAEQASQMPQAQDNLRRREACLAAVAGTKAGIGVTLHCVAFARALQAAGYRTIIVDASGTQELTEGSVGDIPVHSDADRNSLDKIAFDYDVILLDMGTYEPEMEAYFNRMDKKIMITGAAPWELEHINRIFSPAAEEYLFVFNHISKERQDTIRRNMHPLKVIFSHQLEIDALPDEMMMHQLFPEYIPERKTEETQSKKGRRRKKDAGI